MCFEFGSCFGNGRREDYGGERPAHKPPRGRGRGRGGDRRNDGYYGGAVDIKAPPAAYHSPPHDTIHEAGQKAYHDRGQKDHYASTVAEAGGHGRYAAYVHDKQAGNEAPKLPAWHSKVGDDAGYAHTYAARSQEAAADRRQNAGMDYHHFPTATSNTTLVRY